MLMTVPFDSLGDGARRDSHHTNDALMMDPPNIYNIGLHLRNGIDSRIVKDFG